MGPSRSRNQPHSPPFQRRGGCSINKKVPFLSGADGVVSKRSRVSGSLLKCPRASRALLISILI